MALITDFMKDRKFVRTKDADKAFELIKVCLIKALISVARFSSIF